MNADAARSAAATVRILGIETSCDETAAAVVDADQRVISNVVLSQIGEHRAYGGIVPEVAARAHDRNLRDVIARALDRADIADPARELAAVAVTNRPGLIGALLVGVAAAKTLAWLWDRPLITVQHLHAHLHTARMAASADGAPGGRLPASARFVALLVSGGHTSLYHVDGQGPGSATRIGTTRDDAAGECFDKVAALLGLPYPGGPAVQLAAADGNPTAARFPRSLRNDGTLDFSFSGLKTAVRYYLFGQSGDSGALATTPQPDHARLRADVAASFEEAVADILTAKSIAACHRHDARTLAVVGGVAANQRLRTRLTAACEQAHIRLLIPPLDLCTDNAAMIAGIAHHHLSTGDLATLDATAHPRDEWR